MRKTLHIVVTSLILFWAWGVSGVFAQSGTERPFITKWQGKAGKALVIPIFGKEYKLVIKNERGKVVKSEKKLTHEDLKSPYVFTPTEDGTYSVEAGPEGVKYMRCITNEWKTIGDPSSLREVVQFGTITWETTRDMFFECKNMIFATGIDIPDLSKVTDMSGIFSGCATFNQPLTEWKVDKVTNMLGMLSGCTSFNQPLNEWKVDKVTNMRGMFSGCAAFNQPLTEWKVDNVTTMGEMFKGCAAFNQPLNGWRVDKVTNMRGMFSGCAVFNQPLNNWNVSNVTNMSEMFSGCTAFNQPLNHWKVDTVTNMNWMFKGCAAFNQPLNDWKVDNVTRMNWMFSCSAFNQPLNEWRVDRVTDMRGMFWGCAAFNQPLNEWSVDKVTDMREMFTGCSSFNQPLGSWKIRTVVGGLNETAMSPSNYSQTLVGWAGQTDITNNLDFKDKVKGLIYNDEGKAAREKLMGKGWTFEGDIHQSSGVAITPRSLLLVLNKEVTLPLEKWGVEKAEKVTLSTDKGELISYELTADKNGVHIKGLKEGTCTLTATIAAKPGVHKAYTSTCKIEVYIPIERITITPTVKILKVGEEFTLTAHIFPENATKREVKWESDNSAIATVDNNGKVRAHKAGMCWIYAEIYEYRRIVTEKSVVIVVD